MEPRVARTTKSHTAGLSAIPGSTRGVRAVDLSRTSATRNTSAGDRLKKYLQNKSSGNYQPGWEIYEDVHASKLTLLYFTFSLL